MSKDAKRSFNSAAISLGSEKGEPLAIESILPALHPWFDQLEATLVHGNIGFPIPERRDTPDERQLT